MLIVKRHIRMRTIWPLVLAAERSNGIPCAHILMELIVGDDTVKVDMHDGHWRTLESGAPVKVELRDPTSESDHQPEPLNSSANLHPPAEPPALFQIVRRVYGAYRRIVATRPWKASATKARGLTSPEGSGRLG